MLNAPEVIVIGVVVFIFVGAKRMPELARSLGQGIREFKKAASEASDEAMKALTEPEAPRQREDGVEGEKRTDALKAGENKLKEERA